MKIDPRGLALPSYFVLCLLLGGASAGGFAANLLLELLALPLIVGALVVEREPALVPARQLMLMPLLLILIFAIQLLPLPPGLWARLPGRDIVVSGFQLLGQPLPMLPFSLAPRATIAAAVWLLPPLALLYGMVRLRFFRAAWLAGAIVGVAFLSVMVAAGQIAGGAESRSPLYFYDITSVGVGVGFFANANHLATLLLTAFPFLMALYLNGDPPKGAGAQGRRRSALAVVCAGLAALFLVGLLLSDSLAGFGLFVPVAGGCVLMLLAKRRRFRLWQLLAVLPIIAIAVFAVMSAPLGNNLTTNEARVSQVSRYTTFRTTLRAASDFAPAGSGIGTFQQIYRRYEDPTRVTEVFVNHAHSDYLELWLETGIVGMVALLIFWIWWGTRAIALWRTEDVDPIAQAAVIASAAIMAHSMVDYPLRTVAVESILAVCCALMAGARPIRSGSAGGGRRARNLTAD